MKIHKIYLIALGMAISIISVGQDTILHKKWIVFYSVFVNVVPDHFDFPLVGFVNIAKGNHQSAHIGFVNLNKMDFTGVQLGHINITGGFLKGFQAGFVNTSGISVKGFQVGFVNSATTQVLGLQAGFVNSTKKELKGLQLGFVNYADTVSKGFPIGFLSFVKKGGYKALEIGTSELYPLNISYKMGITKFYTSWIVSYNDKLYDPYAFGLGFGSIIPITKSLYFNPELVTQNTLIETNQESQSLATNIGFAIANSLHIILGPSIVYHHVEDGSELNEPFFTLYNNNFSSTQRMMAGFRFAVRYNFK